MLDTSSKISSGLGAFHFYVASISVGTKKATQLKTTNKLGGLPLPTQPLAKRRATPGDSLCRVRPVDTLPQAQCPQSTSREVLAFSGPNDIFSTGGQRCPSLVISGPGSTGVSQHVVALHDLLPRIGIPAVALALKTFFPQFQLQIYKLPSYNKLSLQGHKWTS